jgi:hypothetical protein
MRNHPDSSPENASEVARCTPPLNNRSFNERSRSCGVSPGSLTIYDDKSAQMKNPAFDGRKGMLWFLRNLAQKLYCLASNSRLFLRKRRRNVG